MFIRATVIAHRFLKKFAENHCRTEGVKTVKTEGDDRIMRTGTAISAEIRGNVVELNGNKGKG